MDELLLTEIKKMITDDVALLDCQGDCPDDVAIYEKRYPGQTLRTDVYCNECFAKQILAKLQPVIAKKDVEIARLKEDLTKQAREIFIFIQGNSSVINWDDEDPGIMREMKEQIYQDLKAKYLRSGKWE